MSNASNNPVVPRAKREVHTGDIKPPEIDPLTGDEITEESRIENATHESIVEASADVSFYDHLAYGEQPVTIRIERSSEKNAPKFADCYVNGRGAEVLNNSKWMSVGWLPCGIVITTKRKFVEVLMRSRPNDCETEVVQHDGQDPINKLNFSVRQKFPISIITDKNPIDPSGHEWATRIMSEQ